MTFFNYSVPHLPHKQLNMDVQELEIRALAGSVSPWERSILFKILYLSRSSLPAVELAVNTHVRHRTLFSCELDVASRFVVTSVPHGKHDILWGQNRTPDMGALRLGNTNVIRIAADRLGYFFRLVKTVGESLSPVVGNERNWVFGGWIRSAIVRAFSSKFLSPVGDFNFTLYRRLVFPIYGSRNGI